jgi:hypothetical protein
MLLLLKHASNPHLYKRPPHLASEWHRVDSRPESGQKPVSIFLKFLFPFFIFNLLICIFARGLDNY